MLLARPNAALLTVLLAFARIVEAAPDSQPGTTSARLTELAAAADVVALAQVRDTDYRTRRDIPVSGSAFLAVLIAYKSDTPNELLEVYEKGLHEHECYFPNPSVFEEGRRYLLFLRRDPEEPGRYRGLPAGCALDVLVTGDNRYALRYPASGIDLGGALDGLSEPMMFADRYARIADEALDPAERNALRAAGHIESAGEGQWRFTRGVKLSAVRRLIEPAALTH